MPNKIFKRNNKESNFNDLMTITSQKVIFIGSETLDSVTRWGGIPNSWEDFKKWPECSGCDKPMSFVMQVNGVQVDLKGNQSMQFYACMSENLCEIIIQVNLQMKVIMELSYFYPKIYLKKT